MCQGEILIGKPKKKKTTEQNTGNAERKEKRPSRPKGFCTGMQAQLHSPIMQQVLLIPRAWVSMATRARKPLGAEAIPKDAKREKAPQCKHKSKLTRPELIGFAFIISSLEINKKFLNNHLAVWIN